MRAKRLFRVVADYGDHTTVRHYQSGAAARARADRLREVRVGWPVARSVTVERSDPVTWRAS